jgi:hypothetical protein
MAQPALAPEWDRGILQSVVISRQRDFDALFDGFTELRAVSYVTSARLLLDFIENRGFRRVDILVGENVTVQQLKEDLTHRDRPIVERIASEVESGTLRLRIPPPLPKPRPQSWPAPRIPWRGTKSAALFARN